MIVILQFYELLPSRPVPRRGLSLILTQCHEHACYSQHSISVCALAAWMMGRPSQVMHTEDGKAKASNYDNSTFRFLSINYSLWLSVGLHCKYKGMERKSLKRKEFNIRAVQLVDIFSLFKVKDEEIWGRLIRNSKKHADDKAITSTFVRQDSIRYLLVA